MIKTTTLDPFILGKLTKDKQAMAILNLTSVEVAFGLGVRPKNLLSDKYDTIANFCYYVYYSYTVVAKGLKVEPEDFGVPNLQELISKDILDKADKLNPLSFLQHALWDMLKKKKEFREEVNTLLPTDINMANLENWLEPLKTVKVTGLDSDTVTGLLGFFSRFEKDEE